MNSSGKCGTVFVVWSICFHDDDDDDDDDDKEESMTLSMKGHSGLKGT